MNRTSTTEALCEKLSTPHDLIVFSSKKLMYDFINLSHHYGGILAHSLQHCWSSLRFVDRFLHSFPKVLLQHYSRLSSEL